MIKLIIFDLDGVLVEAKNIHFEALNKALGEKPQFIEVGTQFSTRWEDDLAPPSSGWASVECLIVERGS